MPLSQQTVSETVSHLSRLPMRTPEESRLLEFARWGLAQAKRANLISSKLERVEALKQSIARNYSNLVADAERLRQAVVRKVSSAVLGVPAPAAPAGPQDFSPEEIEAAANEGF